MSDPEDRLDLERFFPYRISRFYSTVSLSLGRRYMALFDITIPEWRIMAVLGSHQPLSAMEICARTDMDKVQVSRAIARMRKAGLVSRRTDPTDRRRSALRLTDKGMQTYQRIVPLARRYEARLLDALSAGERETLERLIDKLQARARDLDTALDHEGENRHL